MDISFLTTSDVIGAVVEQVGVLAVKPIAQIVVRTTEPVCVRNERIKMLTAYFDRFEIQMTKCQAYQVSHTGDCYEDVRHVLSDPRIRKQMIALNTMSLRHTLKEYGAWDYEELMDLEKNFERIVWIAGNDIVENIL